MSKRILCIDDDPDIIDLLNIILVDEGYHVNSASSPSNIFDLIQEHKPDLILLDVYMGPYNGMQICKAMRSYTRTEHTPVLIITSDEDVKDVVKDFGATDLILKPFDTNLLIEKIGFYMTP